MDGYTKLAHAVVIQAVKDWREAVKHPRSEKAKAMKADCEEFFLSGWFVELSGLDGKALLEKLRKECNIHEG